MCKPKVIVSYVDREPGADWTGPWTCPFPPRGDVRRRFLKLHRVSFNGNREPVILSIRVSDEPVPSVA